MRIEEWYYLKVLYSIFWYNSLAFFTTEFSFYERSFLLNLKHTQMESQYVLYLSKIRPLKIYIRFI